MDITQLLVNLVTLTAIEIILGIDNLVFIAIVSNRLPESKQQSARSIGLSLALLGRILLLMTISWVMHLNAPLIHIFSNAFSGKDIFMFFGGGFLLVKATWEIHHEFEPDDVSEQKIRYKKHLGYLAAIAQIIIFDIIFSLDSIFTAVGLTNQLWIMMIAIIIAIIIMIFASKPLSAFIHRHPSIKMLALSFLLLIGTVLVADAFGYAIPRGYIYFSISFSLFLESLNMLRAQRKKRVSN